jgi:hypothetical protein
MVCVCVCVYVCVCVCECVCVCACVCVCVCVCVCCVCCMCIFCVFCSYLLTCLLVVFVVVSSWLCRSIHPILAMALHGHSSAAGESGGNRTHTGRTSAHSSLVMILQILCSIVHDTNAACQRSGSAFQDTNGKARKFQDIFQDVWSNKNAE